MIDGNQNSGSLFLLTNIIMSWFSRKYLRLELINLQPWKICTNYSGTIILKLNTQIKVQDEDGFHVLSMWLMSMLHNVFISFRISLWCFYRLFQYILRILLFCYIITFIYYIVLEYYCKATISYYSIYLQYYCCIYCIVLEYYCNATIGYSSIYLNYFCFIILIILFIIILMLL